MPRTTISPRTRTTVSNSRSAPTPKVDVHDAAERLSTGERFVRRLIFERRIPFTKVGRMVRIDVADLDAFLAAGRVEAVRGEAVRRQERVAACTHGVHQPERAPMGHEGPSVYVTDQRPAVDNVGNTRRPS